LFVCETQWITGFALAVLFAEKCFLTLASPGIDMNLINKNPLVWTETG